MIFTFKDFLIIFANRVPFLDGVTTSESYWDTKRGKASIADLQWSVAESMK